MDLETAQPYWRTGQFPPEYLPFAACNELMAERGADAVTMLASLSKPDRFEIGSLFDRALAELGVPAMPEHEAWLRVAKDLARRIAAGAISPRRGARLLALVWHEAEWLDELKYFMSLDDDLDLYWGTPRAEEIFVEIRREAEEFLRSNQGQPDEEVME